MDNVDRNMPTINTELKITKKFSTKKGVELKTEGVVLEKRRRFSESYTSERKLTELKIFSSLSTIEPETPKTKKNREKHASSPDSLKGSAQIGKLLNTLEAIARITERIKPKQAIHYEGNQIFSIISTKDSKIEKRKECLDEIVKILQVAAENGVVEVKADISNITLTQIVTYLERAKWSSSIVDAEALKKSIHESELNLQEIKNRVLFETKKASSELVQMLFPKELEPEDNLDKNLTLDDLHQIYTAITTPLKLFERVLGVLGETKNQKQISKLITFSQKCIENKIGMRFYPDETLLGVLEKISTYIPEDNNTIIIKVYNERVVKDFKTIEIKSLELQEIEMLNTWINKIQNGLWGAEDVVDYARSVIKKVADAISSVPLDEWITGNLTKRTSTPMYHRMNDLLDNISWLVAQDILESLKLKQRVNVMSFYAAVAQKCLSFGCFASAWAIQSGFNQFPVARLKATFKELPKKLSKEMNGFIELFSSNKNFTNLKAEIGKGGLILCTYPPLLFSRIIAGLEGILEEENDLIVQNKLCILARSVITPLQAMQESFDLAKNLETKSFLDRRIETLMYTLKSVETLEKMSKEIEL